MRGRLLDATVECLVEKGAGELSTNDVVRKAGVSRGALAHHFPTKAELLSAAALHLVADRVAEFRSTFLALPPAKRTVPRALDLLWSFFEGDTFTALLDLIVASRTNAELRGVLQDGPDLIVDVTIDVFVELFPEMAGNAMAEPLVRATLTLFTGMAVTMIVDGDRHGHHAEMRRLVSAMGAGLLPSNGGAAQP